MFDLIIILVIVLSALLAFARGIVRSLIGLLAWVGGLIAAFVLAPSIAAQFRAPADYPFLPYVIVFVIVFILALVLAALIAWPLRTVVHKAGLGFVDRGLGFAFGIARGIVALTLFVLISGLTMLPARDWWQDSLLVAPFEAAALQLKPWLPQAWAQRLHYPARAATTALMKV